jgi:undecaprenyl phosphate-alpha-L-ara4FN deformylase
MSVGDPDQKSPITVGLRVDVDTFNGTRDGVPTLLEILKEHEILATFFFSLGPDNMGRHVWRLLQPRFLIKMLRSNAASLYGWDILLRGTLWPGPVIGDRLGEVIRDTDAAGHEIGLHAWDHHRWQAHVDDMGREGIVAELRQGADSLEKILGRRVNCSAAAGWRCNEDVLREKESYGFAYNSDCRGTGMFRPIVDGVACSVQVPVTLPTYDEMIGRDGVNDGNYNERLLKHIHPDRLNVLTIHAEVEGMSRAGLFREFLAMARERNLRLVPLHELVAKAGQVGTDEIAQAVISGREGNVCWQASAIGVTT